MQNDFILEICVESAERAAAAERGGADRVELCSSLSRGGTTPESDLMREVRRQVRIPIHVLIRPQSDDDFCSPSDFEAMKRDIGLAKELGMDGIVVGILEKTLQVDRKRTRVLVGLAHPLPVTFHRAFDLCRDLPRSLEDVIETGAKRILTSGGKSRVTDGLPALADLIAAAEDRIVIMPGGGIRIGNVRRVLRLTGARELHTSLALSGAQRSPGSRDAQKRATRDTVDFEARVRNLMQLVQASSRVLCPK
jgi:copper homeostasis protein